MPLLMNKEKHMFIEPSTNIKILKNVPLDNTYKHTLFFESSTLQYNYFMSLTKHSLSQQTYQRVKKGSARIGLKAEDLYDCNYMMFQNTNFGTKWFYAFITSVEYINNTVSEITFEIDVMQTWYFDYTLKECFVEREHSTTDVAGDNIVSEPIDIGDIVCGGTGSTGKFNSYVAVIATAFGGTDDDGNNIPTGGTVGGLFTGLDYVAGRIDNAEQVNALIDFLAVATEANKVDSITSIWVMPSVFYTSDATPVVEVAKIAKNTKIGSYTPRNKKLLTFPYNYLGVDCGNNSAIYRYEWFDSEDGKCGFMMNSCVAPNTEISLVPADYNGDDFNYVEKLVMKGFPQVGYSIDAFRAWVAQESTGQFLTLFGSSMGVGAGIASGNLVGAGLGAVGMAHSMNNIVLATNRPPQARGNNGSSVDVSTRTKDFYFRYMHISPQYARIIDDFFDVYGYATQRVKVPNISARPQWNYTKTKDCVIVGSLPADDMRKICGIFNSGVTFWKNGANVGNYSLNNGLA